MIDFIAQHCIAHHQSITTAESCTGGLLAGALTEISGSSQWFKQGWVTYSNEAKERLLKVQAATLEQYGAVSEATVQEMAENARILALSDYAIAISGIAGPTGGSAEKPVGTVWFACVTERQTITQKQHFQGNRSQVRQQAVNHALQMIQQALFVKN